MKKIPIGVSDYKKLIEEDYYYVDKTLFIRDIFLSGEVVLIPRPRRFGKTLNLSMLRYFLEKGETSMEHLFEHTEIWLYEEYRKQQGKAPVIFVTFKDIKEATWEGAYEKFAYVLYKEFERHSYLLKSDHIELYDKEMLQRIIERRAPEGELKSSLHFLARMLHKHYGVKPYILIDEYDVPVQESSIHGYYDQAMGFVRGLLALVQKDEQHIQKGVITGILMLTKAGIFSGLNSLDVYDFTNNRLSERFGFTEVEVNTLLEYYGLDERSAEVKHWYDGYTFGDSHSLYNPWSVLSFVKNNGSLRNYWINTSDNILMKGLIGRASIEVKAQFEKLIAGKTIDESINQTITFPDLEIRPDILWTLLLFTGYLTCSTYTLKKGKVYATLKIPNEEIAQLYAELISDIFKESVLGGQVGNLLKALSVGDTEVFSKLLQSFVHTSMSSYDLSSTEPEKSYHLFVLGLMVALSDLYEVRSNKESGLGRYDITLIPRVNNKPGIVMEFKVLRKGETLETAAQRVLEQITQKKYTQELFDRSIDRILAYGISFEGKNIYVLSEEITA